MSSRTEGILDDSGTLLAALIGRASSRNGGPRPARRGRHRIRRGRSSASRPGRACAARDTLLLRLGPPSRGDGDRHNPHNPLATGKRLSASSVPSRPSVRPAQKIRSSELFFSKHFIIF